MDQVSVNVQQDSAIILLVHDMVLEDLVVQGTGARYYARHDCCYDWRIYKEKMRQMQKIEERKGGVSAEGVAREALPDPV